MYISANIGGKIESRPYTPITSDDEMGYFELVIKVCAVLANVNCSIQLPNWNSSVCELAVVCLGQGSHRL